VIGPMVVAAVMLKDDEVLRRLKVKDSKQLSPDKREMLATEIHKVAKVEVNIIEPEELDALMSEMNLNEIEVLSFASLIERLHPDKVFLDACDVDEERFAQNIRLRLNYHPDITCKHKGDVLFPVVSAASILAKTTRDARMRAIEKELGEPIGTGYCHDQKTIGFLQKWIKEKGDAPPYTRRCWYTTKKALSLSKTSKLDDWND